MRPLTCDTPKPMTRLCGRPVLAYILDLLARHGFDEAAVTLRYLPDAVTNWLEEGVWHTKNREVKLHFIEEDRPLGTAGGVKHAADWYDDSFLVISGDALTDFDLSAAMKFHKEKRAAATLLVKQVKDPREYGLVNYDEENRITCLLYTSFIFNTILAVLLTWFGNLLSLDLYLAAVVVFGTRIFHNLAELRRMLLHSSQKNDKLDV